MKIFHIVVLLLATLYCNGQKVELDWQTGTEKDQGGYYQEVFGPFEDGNLILKTTRNKVTEVKNGNLSKEIFKVCDTNFQEVAPFSTPSGYQELVTVLTSKNRSLFVFKNYDKKSRVRKFMIVSADKHSTNIADKPSFEIVSDATIEVALSEDKTKLLVCGNESDTYQLIGLNEDLTKLYSHSITEAEVGGAFDSGYAIRIPILTIDNDGTGYFIEKMYDKKKDFYQNKGANNLKLFRLSDSIESGVINEEYLFDVGAKSTDGQLYLFGYYSDSNKEKAAGSFLYLLDPIAFKLLKKELNKFDKLIGDIDVKGVMVGGNKNGIRFTPIKHYQLNDKIAFVSNVSCGTMQSFEANSRENMQKYEGDAIVTMYDLKGDLVVQKKINHYCDASGVLSFQKQDQLCFLYNANSNMELGMKDLFSMKKMQQKDAAMPLKLSILNADGKFIEKEVQGETQTKISSALLIPMSDKTFLIRNVETNQKGKIQLGTLKFSK